MLLYQLQLQQSPDDENGAEVVRKSAQAVIAALFISHSRQVYRWALRLLGNPCDAEEATQEVFLRALRGAASFEGRCAATTWLHRITTNYCLNVRRDRRRRIELANLAALPTAIDPSDSGPPEVAWPHLKALLGSAEKKQVLAAAYVYRDGRSHKEAAQLLGVTSRTVCNLLARFRAHVLDKGQVVATRSR